MPRYDYRCPACEAVREEIHSLLLDPEFTCETCAVRLQRVPTGGLTPRAKTHGGYHPGLALKQDDPTAWAEGPHSLQKLVDERKRQGYTTLDL